MHLEWSRLNPLNQICDYNNKNGLEFTWSERCKTRCQYIWDGEEPVSKRGGTSVLGNHCPYAAYIYIRHFFLHYIFSSRRPATKSLRFPIWLLLFFNDFSRLSHERTLVEFHAGWYTINTLHQHSQDFSRTIRDDALFPFHICRPAFVFYFDNFVAEKWPLWL